MGSVNKVILIGNLGADPELRRTASGYSVCNLRIATTDRYRDRDDNPQEKTEWHRVVVWGRQAEHCKEYLRKGRQVYVEGSLETHSWEDRDGNKRYTTEVRARQVVFLGSRDTGGEGYTGPSQAPPQQGGRWSEGQGDGYRRPGGGSPGGYPPGPGSPPPGEAGKAIPQEVQPDPNASPEPSSGDGYFKESPEGISEDDLPF